MTTQCRGECLIQGSADQGFGIYTPGDADHCSHYVRTSPCYCIPWPCPNVKFCSGYNPAWVLEAHHGFCCSCAHFDFGKIKFKKNINNESCDVCMEYPEYFVKFPSCDHYFCKKCTQEIIYWDETKYHLSPVPYGCPPCPNGCENPIRGKQCYCIEYWNDEEGELGVIQQWEQENTEQATEYNEAEGISIEDSMTSTEDAYASGKCPLCRSTIHHDN